MNNWLIYNVYVFFILLQAGAFLFYMHGCRMKIKSLHSIASEESMRANHWYKQFNEVIEGSDGAWARRLLDANEALSKGLDEAIDDHMQEQETWDEARTQYKATIEDLQTEVLKEQNISQGWKHLYEEKQAQLEDVQQTALEMQIELTAPEAKTPEQIYRETHEALGEYDRISPDTEITLADNAGVKDPSGTVIGTVDGVRNTPEGIVVDMTFNDNVPWAGKSATGVVPYED